MADQEKDLRRRATILNEIEDRQKRIQALVERGAVSQALQVHLVDRHRVTKCS